MNSKQTRLWALDRQARRLEKRLTALRRLSDRYSTVRLLLFFIGAPILWAVYFWAGTGPGLILTGGLVGTFGLVVRGHRRVARSIQAHEVWLGIKRTHMARLTLDWDGLPRGRAALPPDDHPFARDLDLVGERSIHRLLDTAISREGSQRLRDWLLDTRPDQETIERRQALVRELTPLTGFRDRLTLAAALASTDINEEWEGRRLLTWLESRLPPATLRPWLIVLLLLAAANIALFALHTARALPPLWPVTLLFYAAVFGSQRRAFANLFQDTLYLADALRKLRAVLGFLERYPYTRHERLKALCAPLGGEARPGTALRRINRVAAAASVQGNPFLWLAVNVVMPWDLIVAYRLNQLKADVAERLPAWLDVWFELEALNSLANFAYLNPEYTLPEVTAEGGETALRGRDLGHPLIPYPQKVCNDFTLKRGEVAIITGSNMAGKSSFLRTVGVNLRLAYAGGPVNAGWLHVSLFRLFTAIQVTDSVTDGISYFYAEVKRLKALLEALTADDALPLLFLIDEIFQGTNNRERLIGSRAYLRALAEGGGTGLLATHDLELVNLAEDIPQLSNYHFKETVAEGRMQFDYRLRPGPCPTTNALIIMRMEGLPVE